MSGDVLARIRARCHDDGGCWIWEGYTLKGKMPIMSFEGRPTTVRSVAYMHGVGKIRYGHEVVRTCESTLCCNPAHLEQVTIAERRRRLAARRNDRQPAQLVRQIRETRGKLDMEKAREIRASDEQAKVLAERYGVSSTLIGYVRRGISWAEPSPFAGLGARA